MSVKANVLFRTVVSLVNISRVEKLGQPAIDEPAFDLRADNQAASLATFIKEQLNP